MKRTKFWMSLLMMTGLMVVFTSCQDDFVRKIEKHGTGSPVNINLKQPKVLYLIVDGLRGQILPQINPPTLTNMTRHAVFAYNGVSNDYANNASTWADMLTGVEPDKHHIKRSGFAGNNLNKYPMFFKRLKEAHPNDRTAAFCSSATLSDHLIMAADENKSFNGDDEAVTDAIVNELGKDSITAILGEFHSVQEAGENFGYDSSVQEYVDAVFQFDQYVSDMMTALKSRKNYKNENWLVIVASNRGGNATIPPSQQDNTKFSDPTLNTFAIIYNSQFSTRFVAKPNVANLPYEGYAIHLKGEGNSTTDLGDAVNAYVPENKASLYNFGTTGGYTVQIKVKVFDFGSVWPSFFGKRNSSFNRNEHGWMFMFHGDKKWRVKIGGNISTGLQNFEDSSWHTLTLKIYKDGTKRMAATYTDGAKGGPVDITGDNLDNNYPLISGWADGYGGNAELYITDIKIYDTALADSYIDDHGGDVGLNETSPYYNNIIGYWPATDGTGNGYKDYSPYHNDMVFNITDNNKGDFGWHHFSDLSGLLSVPLPNGIFKDVPRGVDLPLMIYKWMGLDISGWNLDGRFWIPKYEK